MKYNLLIIFFSLTFNLFGQSDSIKSKLEANRSIIYCEIVTLNAVDSLSILFKTNKTYPIIDVINEWTNLCGLSESSERALLLYTILTGNNSKHLIERYISNNFHYFFERRISNSLKPNYKYIYEEEKSFFYSYVPLRHELDSITKKLSSDLLENNKLSPDEKLICILFSENVDLFYTEHKKKEFKKSFIHNHFKEKEYNKRIGQIGWELSTGLYSPIGKSKVFSFNPVFGLTVSSPLEYKFVVNLGVKLRSNINDKDFKFFAMGDTNIVNSDISLFFGGFVGYKIFDNNNIVVLPRAGMGYEEISTGLSESIENSDDTKYYDVKTVHFTLGLSVMKKFFNTKFVGFSLNYHYCPYGLVKNLYTPLNNNAYSLELFFRL